MAQFMVVLDIAIVNVALPDMRHSLGLSTAGQQWVINAYTLTFAGFLMVGGRAADLFGRKRVFIVGLVIFTFCSLIGGLAQSGAWLIWARAAQGIGGAILAPATLSLITTTYTEPAARQRALGAWSATAASGASIGVLAGGVLTDLLNWRWVLFVNVPIGIALLVAARASLVESRNEGARRNLDLPGAFTVTAGLAVLVYGIVSTDTHPWGSTRTIGTLAIGAALLAMFFVIESRLAAHPLVPLGVFRRRTLSLANGVAVMIGTAMFGLWFFLSLYLQQVVGYSPLRAGLAFLPAGLATLSGALLGTRLVSRLGVRRQLVVGPLIAVGGLAWLTSLSVGDGYFGSIFGPAVLVGFGLGLSFVPMTVAATAGVPAHEAGLASALVNTSRQVGGALGLAAMATVAANASRHAVGRVALLNGLTTGYDRAFAIGAGALVVAVALALALPSPRPVAPAPEAAMSGLADRELALDA
jgi:EmrB/QacA subfamily drug resistance transporter